MYLLTSYIHLKLIIYFSFYNIFRWFCHFDDDNYVNVPALVRKLKQYDHNKDWYLGKPSIPEPLEIMDREHDNVSTLIRLTFSTQKILNMCLKG